MNLKIVKRVDDSITGCMNLVEMPITKSFEFPGGEVGIKLSPTNYKYIQTPATHQTVIARIANSADVMRLIMCVDALRRLDSTPINLFLPYVPYARQDRVCDGGESFSVKAFADMLAHLKFNNVTIVDPHSEVTPAVLEAAFGTGKVKVIKQFDIIHMWGQFNQRVLKSVTFVSPDAGANKKTSELAGYFNHHEFIRADKLRDLSTGQIKETIVYADDLEGRDIVIADDICDGGRTFIELAAVLKKKNAGKIILYVTHGIFSKGVNALTDNGIDEIWTTDSFREDLKNVEEVVPSLHVLNLEQLYIHLM